MNHTDTVIRVLIVDDNALAVEALQRWMNSLHDMVLVGWASDVESALSIAARESPDLVFLDLDIPGVETLVLLARLRSEPLSLRVVMFSGHISTSSIDRSLDAGAIGYISKDEPTALIAALAKRAARGEFVLSPLVQKSYLGGE